jgi:hypothetical protein
MSDFFTGWEDLLSQAETAVTLEAAFNDLKIFMRLSDSRRAKVCQILCHEGKVEELLEVVKEDPDKVPLNCLGTVYKAVINLATERKEEPTKHPFLQAENARFQDMVRNLLLRSSPTTFVQSERERYERFFTLISALMLEENSLIVKILTLVYKRCRVIPKGVRNDLHHKVLRLAGEDASARPIQHVTALRAGQRGVFGDKLARAIERPEHLPA